MIENYYGIVKLLSRDKVVVELSRLVLVLLVTLTDFAKLWVNLHKHLLYVTYRIGLLQLFKFHIKTLMKDFVLQQSPRL